MCIRDRKKCHWKVHCCKKVSPTSVDMEKVSRQSVDTFCRMEESVSNKCPQTMQSSIPTHGFLDACLQTPPTPTIYNVNFDGCTLPNPHAWVKSFVHLVVLTFEMQCGCPNHSWLENCLSAVSDPVVSIEAWSTEVEGPTFEKPYCPFTDLLGHVAHVTQGEEPAGPSDRPDSPRVWHV